MARPRKPIDPKKVERLASIGCPAEEIAAVLDCSQDTLERRFAENIQRGLSNGRKRCRSWIFAKAAKGDTAATIFLAKAFCNMREHPDFAINVSATAVGNSVQFTEETKKQLENFHYEIQQRVYRRLRNPVPSPNGNGHSAPEQQPALN